MNCTHLIASLKKVTKFDVFGGERLTTMGIPVDLGDGNRDLRATLRTVNVPNDLVRVLAAGQGLTDLRDIDGVLIAAPKSIQVMARFCQIFTASNTCLSCQAECRAVSCYLNRCVLCLSNACVRRMQSSRELLACRTIACVVILRVLPCDKAAVIY